MGLHLFAFWDLQIYRLSTEKIKKLDAILCLSASSMQVARRKKSYVFTLLLILA